MPARGEFSQDGTYLVVGSSEDYQVFDTQSWRRVFRVPRDRVGGGYGSIQFSPDGRLLAIILDQLRYIRLLETGSWQELASLEDSYPLCFSADGSQLATYSDETKMIMVWNLRLVRRDLAAMGLDWETKATPAAYRMIDPRR
jgi:WD40 repeat protein